jgi:hypothetical protein
LEKGNPIGPRHVKVENENIEVLLLEQTQRDHAVFSLYDSMARTFEDC